jgi:hypothetical protein
MNLKKIWMTYLALLFIVVLFSCNYIPDERPLLEKTHSFIQAVENKQPTVALSLLTKETSSKINTDKFSQAEGDFQKITEAFRDANITTRSTPGANNHQEKEVSMEVSNVGKGKRFVRFVLINKNGEWKIANILMDS